MSLAAFLFLQQASTIVLPYPALENCYRDHSENCRVEVAQLEPVQLAYLNKLVTETITTRTDSSPLDPWVSFPADHMGDCDDDVATKRAALTALGFPPEAMTVEVGEVTEPDGRIVGHAVLVVELRGQRWRMDRKTPDLLPPADAPRLYPWRPIAVQSRDTIEWRQS